MAARRRDITLRSRRRAAPARPARRREDDMPILTTRRGLLVAAGVAALGWPALPVLSGESGPDDAAANSAGIWGAISGFGPFRIAGVPVSLPLDFEPDDVLHDGRLAVGETLAVEATVTQEGSVLMQAARIPALVGPVTAPLGPDGRLTVMGAPVGLARRAQVVDARAEAIGGAALRSGETVAVYGLWRDGRVEATRIARRAEDAPAQAAGVLAGAAAGSASEAALGPVPVSGISVETGARGYVELVGVWRDGVLAADRMRRSVFGPFRGPLARAVVEGSLAPRPDGTFEVEGLGLAPAAGSRVAPPAGRRLVMQGALGRGFRIDEAAEV
jgi:hypothetical protein